MLLTLRTTHRPATDLGWLLRKNPANTRSFSLTFGQAHLVWPEVSEEAATAALLVELDPVALVRGRTDGPESGPLAMYVNDRPYVASSFLSVALRTAFGSALNGSAPERPELVDTPLPLEIGVEVVAARGGGALLERLFGPLGYEVRAERLPLAGSRSPSPLYRLRLSGTLPVRDALRHLYVLLPVLDDDKHYWVGADEVDKLVARGEGWLGEHPERELVASRYLKHRGALAREALSRLQDSDQQAAPSDAEGEEAEEALERPLRLNDLRLDRVVEVLREQGVRRVLDLGCGEGKLLRRLLAVAQFEEVVGVDVSARALDLAERRLDTPRTPLRWRERLKLLHGSLTYRDRRLDGYDAAAVVEVIEHLDPGRLDAFAAALFGGARPGVVVLTTPNAEYNARLDGLEAGHLRHPDHRFEWTRAAFESWAEETASAHGYTVSFEPVGPIDAELGAPTQMGVFRCR